MAGGGFGAGAARGDGEWLRAYGRAAAMVPRVGALAAGRARLEAVNAIQHEFWEARDVLLQCRLLQVDESRRTWEAKCMAHQTSGDDRMFAEPLKSDNEDLKAFIQVLELENEELKIRMKEVEGGAGHCQNAADHEHIAGDLEAALRRLNQAHEALCSEKDKEVSALIAEKDKEFSALIAEKDLVREQFRTLERDYADLRSYSSKQAEQVTEAKQELEQLQVASQKKDDEIRKLRARAKTVEAQRKLLRQELSKEADGEIEKCKDRQPETNRKCKKDTSETLKTIFSQGPALRGKETKSYSSKQILAKDELPQTGQKRKCTTFLSNDNDQNENDEKTSNQVLVPLKRKRVPGKGDRRQPGLLKGSVEGAQSAAAASENVREDTLKELAACRAELAHLETQHAQLVGISEERGKEIGRLGVQRKMQCDIFKEVYNRLFTILGNLGITFTGSINFQGGDVGSYALFFQEFVAKLEEATKDFEETIEVEARELATLAGERVFTNLHLIDPTFPFAELVKPPKHGKEREASHAATAGFVEELVSKFKRIEDEDEGLEDPAHDDGLEAGA